MTSERDLIYPMIAEATREAQQDNLRNARLLLKQVASRINTIAPKERIGPVHAALQAIWGCGRVDFCEEALSAVSGCLLDVERGTVEEMYRFSLEYIKGGRDPYFMEGLQPDFQMVAKHLVIRFDGAAIGSPLPD